MVDQSCWNTGGGLFNKFWGDVVVPRFYRGISDVMDSVAMHILFSLSPSSNMCCVLYSLGWTNGHTGHEFIMGFIALWHVQTSPPPLALHECSSSRRRHPEPGRSTAVWELCPLCGLESLLFHSDTISFKKIHQLCCVHVCFHRLACVQMCLEAGGKVGL